MIKKTIIILLMLATLSSLTENGLAISISVDKQSIYEKGKLYANLKDYVSALEQFQKLGDYQDSLRWRYYCEGMIDIETANEKQEKGYLRDAKKDIETAFQFYNMLSLSKFEDTEKLSVYCEARLYELQGLSQSAIDLYVGLIGTLDSDIRYFRLTGGYVLPTQAPIEKEAPPFFPVIPAHVDRTIETFLGPGSDYIKQGEIELNTESLFGICAREGNYYLIEIITEQGKIRCWAFTLRILRDAEELELEIGKTKRSGYIIQPVTGLYGPGDGYLVSSVILPVGKKVTVFESEGAYTMIEVFLNNIPMRLWVSTESISK